MEPTDVQRWLAGRRRAAKRERDELRAQPTSAEDCFRRSMALREVVGAAPDADEESLAFHRVWAEIRRRARRDRP